MTVCVFCGRTIQRAVSLGLVFSFHQVGLPLLCLKCRENFSEIDATSACPGCFRAKSNGKMCQDCDSWQEKYPGMALKHRALYVYNEQARAYMNRFKFQGDLLLVQVFRESLEKALKPYQKTHRIVPIPASARSLKKRGFNQVELLLQEAGISYTSLLEHTGTQGLQSEKDRRERLFSKQPFQVKAGVKWDQPILLVDDVYTTGRTIFHAREILEKYRPTESFSLFR
jgi:competence protein ComFC